MGGCSNDAHLESLSVTLQARFIRWITNASILGAVVISFVVYYMQLQYEKESAYEKIRHVLVAVDAVQDYIRHSARPSARKHLEDDGFILELMSSSFVARQFTDRFLVEFPNYQLKFASLNPFNPLNTPTKEELRLIEYFSGSADDSEWNGTLKYGDVEYYVVARPIRMASDCLYCHGDPANAPDDLVRRYPGSDGFGHSVGDVSLKLVGVPIKVTFASAMETALPIIASFWVIMSVVILSTYRLFRKMVSLPMKKLSGLAEHVASGHYNVYIEQSDKDSEFASVANSFNRMADSIKQEIGRYRFAERKIHNDYESQRAFSTALDISLQTIPLEEKFSRILAKILDNPWLAGWCGGAIYMVTENDEITSVVESELSKNAAERCVKNAVRIQAMLGRDDSFRLESPEIRQLIYEKDEESCLCFPVVGNGKITSFLCVYSNEDVEVSDEAYSFLSNMALAIGTLLSHAATIDALKESEERYTLIAKLKETQNQLLQSEKMAAIGQLAAGVAHEINNPVGYVYSNLGTLSRYVKDLFQLIHAYEILEAYCNKDIAEKRHIEKVKEEIEFDFLRNDLPALVNESMEGADKVRQIVRDLKEFAHVDDEEWREIDLHRIIDSTLNVVRNELKYKATVTKHYGDIPLVKCLPTQLGQVFMNLLVNAGQAIRERGNVVVSTGQKDDMVWVEVEDDGVGMDEEVKRHIFEPFFTTKPVGMGTGLGLSVSYGIVRKHGGYIDCESAQGKGTRFRVWININGNEEFDDASDAS